MDNEQEIVWSSDEKASKGHVADTKRARLPMDEHD